MNIKLSRRSSLLYPLNDETKDVRSGRHDLPFGEWAEEFGHGPIDIRLRGDASVEDLLASLDKLVPIVRRSLETEQAHGLATKSEPTTKGSR